MFWLQKSGFSSTPWGSAGLEERFEAIIVIIEKVLELRVGKWVMVNLDSKMRRHLRIE
jgi:hypothetical protein